jgi:hypothetical protein
LHHILTKYRPHITLKSHGTIPCNHSIILHSTIRFLGTTYREEIELDTEVEDEIEKDLEEVEDR